MDLVVLALGAPRQPKESSACSYFLREVSSACFCFPRKQEPAERDQDLEGGRVRGQAH